MRNPIKTGDTKGKNKIGGIAMDFERNLLGKIRGLILFTLFVLVALWNYKALFRVFQFLGNVLFPFALGGAIAFVINVPMSFLERKCFGKMKKGGRQISFAITIVLFVGIIGLVLFLVVPELGKTIGKLGENMRDFLPQVQKKIINVLGENSELSIWIGRVEWNWDTLWERGLQFLKNGVRGDFKTTFETAKSIISGFTTFTIAFVFGSYIVLQKERLHRQVKKILYAFIPRDWTEIILAFCSLTYDTFAKFLSGQFLEALILGGLFLLFMLVFGIPYALLISVIIAITSLLPVFGALVGAVVGFVLIFSLNPTKAILFLVLSLVLQQVEGDVIYPKVVGRHVGLPSIWVLFSVAAGASLMGIVGMLIFIPISSVVYSMLKGIVHRRLKRREIHIE